MNMHANAGLALGRTVELMERLLPGAAHWTDGPVGDWQGWTRPVAPLRIDDAVWELSGRTKAPKLRAQTDATTVWLACPYWHARAAVVEATAAFRYHRNRAAPLDDPDVRNNYRDALLEEAGQLCADADVVKAMIERIHAGHDRAMAAMTVASGADPRTIALLGIARRYEVEPSGALDASMSQLERSTTSLIDARQAMRRQALIYRMVARRLRYAPKNAGRLAFTAVMMRAYTELTGAPGRFGDGPTSKFVGAAYATVFEKRTASKGDNALDRHIRTVQALAKNDGIDLALRLLSPMSRPS